MKKLLTLFTLLLTVCSGAWADKGDILFSQSFDATGAGSIAYDAPTNSTPRARNITSLEGIVGNGDNLFTSIACSIKKGDIAINSSTGGGDNVDATGIFQVYSNGDNAGYWSINRTSAFAGTAPKAIQVSMDIWYDNIGSGSENQIQFAVGNEFTDGLTDKSQSASKVHSGFAIYGNSNAIIKAYDDKNTTVYNTALTQSTWLSITWVINNSGETLTYDNPTGSGTSELNNDCYDLWLKTQAGLVSTYTKIATNIAATTTSVDLQNFYVGNKYNKKHEFRLDNVMVTDLTPSAGPVAPNFTLGTSDNPIELNFGTDYSLADVVGVDATFDNVVSASTGIATITSGPTIHPVAEGETTITFDNTADANYTATTGNTLYIKVVKPTCATPTITVGAFNFANKGYKVTIDNNEEGSTLKYSTDNETWNDYTGTLYATTTTHYYAKSVKTNYNDSEVAGENVTNTFDGGKKYIAWVYQSETYTDNSVTYNLADDGIYLALKDLYNVVPMAISNGTSITVDHDIKNADLIINAEAMSGSSNLAVGMKNFLGVKPMMNFKIWAYGSSKNGSERWGWGKPANVDESGIITPASTTYKLLNGVTLDGGNIILFSGTTGRVQTVDWTSEPTNNVNMATNTDVAMHAIIDNNHLDKQFFGFGVSCNYRTQYNENTKTIVKNAVAMLIAGTERLDAEMATVSATIPSSGWGTYCSSYALDFSDAGTDVEAYAVSAYDVDNLTITYAKQTGVVPAGTGILLKGTAGAANIVVSDESGSAPAVNKLVGFVAPTEYTKDGATRYLGLSGGNWKEMTAGAIPANKAVLEITSDELTTLQGKLNTGAKFTIILDDEPSGETDGIRSVENGELRMENYDYYNLAGQRVGKDYRGIVIVNGKKYVRK